MSFGRHFFDELRTLSRSGLFRHIVFYLPANYIIKIVFYTDIMLSVI